MIADAPNKRSVRIGATSRSRKHATYVFDCLVDGHHALFAGLLVPGHHFDELLVLFLLLGIIALRLLLVDLDFGRIEFALVHLRT